MSFLYKSFVFIIALYAFNFLPVLCQFKQNNSSLLQIKNVADIEQLNYCSAKLEDGSIIDLSPLDNAAKPL